MPRPLLVSLLSWTALLLGASGCVGASAGIDEGDESAGESGAVPDDLGFELTQVEYELGWLSAGARAVELEAGEAFAVRNDLGFVVRVDQAFLTTRGMSLTLCPVDAAASFGLGEQRGLRSDGAVEDPTAVYHGMVEDLAQPQSSSFGAQAFSMARYCGAHFVFGQASATSLNMPDPTADPQLPDMVGRTLYLRGEAHAPDGSVVYPFEIDIHHADGLLSAFLDAELDAGVDLQRETLRVAVLRDPGTAFDGVDFSSASQMDLDIDVLHNLATRARLRLSSVD